MLFSFKNNLSDWRLEYSGLDNGCHQITIFENNLYIIETYIQRIAKFKIESDGKLVHEEFINLWKPSLKDHLCSSEDENKNYMHINSITVQDGRFFFMCSMLGRFGERLSSKIQVWDPIHWKLLDEYNLDRYYCHDLVFIGHEIYFFDMTGTLCILNIVTRKISEIFKRNEINSRVRGLSIGIDEKFFASSISSIFTKTVNYKISAYNSATCITRFDGNDYNNTTSVLRKSNIRTVSPENYPFFKKMVDPLGELFEKVKNFEFSEDAKKYRLPLHINNHTIPETVDEFLGPIFESLSDLEPYIKNNEKIVIRGNPEFESVSNVFDADDLSGQVYYYPEGHGMGWHTNRQQLTMFPSHPYRVYLVRTDGPGTFFFYRHLETKKIHAVHDIDATLNVFDLRGPLWHSIGSIKGNRISVGYRKNIELY